MAIILVLHGRFQQFIAFLAPVCSSYSAVNIGTSKRSILTPFGQIGNTHVRRGNKMISRWGCQPPKPPFKQVFTKNLPALVPGRAFFWHWCVASATNSSWRTLLVQLWRNTHGLFGCSKPCANLGSRFFAKRNHQTWIQWCFFSKCINSHNESMSPKRQLGNERFKQFQVFWPLQFKVYKVVFDMNTFGTRSQKPTMLLTNSKSVCKLHGRRFKKRRTGKSLCKRYKNKAGKPAFCGTKRLKQSQKPSCNCWIFLVFYEIEQIEHNLITSNLLFV